METVLKSIVSLNNAEELAHQIATRMAFEQEFIAIFIRKYRKISIENRTLTKRDLETVQDDSFKKELQRAKMDSSEEDDDKLE